LILRDPGGRRLNAGGRRLNWRKKAELEEEG